MDTRKLNLIYKAIVATHTKKTAKLLSLLTEVSVGEMDDLLTQLFDQCETLYETRQRKAAKEGITTPPPSPPNLGGIRVTAPPDDKPATATNGRGHSFAPPASTKFPEGGSLDVAYKIIERHPHGITYADYREEYERAEAADPEKFHTSHHGAIRSLKRTRHVVLYKTRLFTYENQTKFVDEVKSGKISDIAGKKNTSMGMWNEAALDCLNKLGGGDWVKFRDVVECMASRPGFEDKSNVHAQTAVALRKLVENYGLVEKTKGREKGLYRVKVPGATLDDAKQEEKTRASRAKTPEALH